jgi:hypothetical protein
MLRPAVAVPPGPGLFHVVLALSVTVKLSLPDSLRLTLFRLKQLSEKPLLPKFHQLKLAQPKLYHWKLGQVIELDGSEPV